MESLELRRALEPVELIKRVSFVFVFLLKDWILCVYAARFRVLVGENY